MAGNIGSTAGGVTALAEEILPFAVHAAWGQDAPALSLKFASNTLEMRESAANGTSL